MIRHIVMWKVEGAGPDDRSRTAAEIREALERLPSVVPGIRSFEVGVNELAGDQASDVVLVSTFDDWDGLKAYGVDPAHVEVAEMIRQLTTERLSADYEV
jgi:Stress responsive A/B Barrel Domain